jgi:hypothetical protein
MKMSSYFKHWGSSHSNRMLSESQNKSLRELDAGLRGLTAGIQWRSLAQLENPLAVRRAEQPMNAAGGCSA